MCHKQDGGEDENGQHQIGHRLSHHHHQRSHGRNEQHLHRAFLLLTDNGDRGHHSTDEHEQHAHDGGHEIVGRAHLGIVEQLGVDDGGRTVDQHLLGIVGPLLGHIGVGPINHQLQTLVSGCKDDGKVCPLATYQLFGLLRRSHRGSDSEIFGGGQTLHCLLCLRTHLRGDHHRAHIPDVRGDGEAEQQHQHHRHAEENEHRTSVAQDVTRFLENKREELLHLFFLFSGSGVRCFGISKYRYSEIPLFHDWSNLPIG